MTTIKDIAKKTGFSVTTVSRALNGFSDVNKETAKIIQDAADKMQYTPNISARNLVTKKSSTIGLLVNDLKRVNQKDNFLFEVLCGALHHSTKRNYEVILINTTSSKQRNKTFIQTMKEKNLDGVIIQGLRKEDVYLKEAIESDVPTILIDIPVQNESTGYVTTDQSESVRNTMKYLYRLGHRKIAFMNGHPHAYVSEIRLQGYQKAFEDLGLPYQEEHVCTGDFDEDKAYQAALDFLLRYQDVTAFLCASDVMALGVLRAAKNFSLRIPDDLSIVGFDNILLTQYVTPTLTTIGQNPYDQGKAAARLLIDMIVEQTSKRANVLKNELIIRESTGSPHQNSHSMSAE